MRGFKSRQLLTSASAGAIVSAASLVMAGAASAQTQVPPVTPAEAPPAQQAPVSDAPGVPDPQQPAGDAAVSPGDVAPPVEGESTDVAEVVVTGTRVRGVAPVGSSIVAVGRQDIALSSGVTTTQVLQEIPQIFNLGITDATRGGNGGAGNITFGSSVNIRGIGPNATLTIVNGHRVSPQGTTGAAPDPSVIPTVMLERVEIVPDGASAIYGSDAIAGVANLIMRRNFEGIEVQAYGGWGDGYEERNLSIIGGYRWGTGQITAALENGFRGRLAGPDRPFFRSDLRDQGGTDFRVTNCSPGNVVVGGVSYAIPAGGATPTNLIAGTANRCDNIRNQDILPEQDRISAAFTLDQRIGEEVRFYADGYWSRREFSRRVPMAAQVLNVPATNAFFVRPAGTTGAVQVQYSFDRDFGPFSTTTGFSETFTVAAGFEIDLPYEWVLNIGGNYGRTDEISDSQFGINAGALTAALASSNPATAFNPFGTTANNANVLATINNNINLAPGQNDNWVAEVSAGGPLFRLPAGDVRLALGVEYVSFDLRGGQVQGAREAPAARYGAASRTVQSAYAELLIPITSEEMNIPLFRRLDLNIAGRIDEYSDFGSTRNPKIGVNWSPIEGLTLRGNYGTSFRAPALSQIVTINATPGIFFQNYSDPTANGGAGGIRQGIAINGPNPNLGPETATTWSIGGEWSPPQIPGLRLSVNYFDIDYQDQIIGYLSNLTILQNEAAYSSIIIRNPSQAFLQALLAEGRTINGGNAANVLATTLFVDGRPFNTATTIARGFDFTALYRLQTDSWGDFTVGFNGTYFTDYITSPTATAPATEQVNLINQPPRFRGRGNLSWRYGDFFAAGWVNYYNSYTNNLSGTSVREVDEYVTVDARLSYTLGEGFPTWSRGTTFALDVRNLFDEQPPFVNITPSANGGGGFDPQAANPIGRVVGVSVSHRF